MPLIALPQQVENVPHIENHVKVEAGNNFDFASLSEPTPFKLKPQEEIKKVVVEGVRLQYSENEQIPYSEPAVSLLFGKNKSAVTQGMRETLLNLDPRKSYVVVANVQATELNTKRLIKLRARGVESSLKGMGFKDVKVIEYGAAEDGSPRGLRVDIFER